MDLIHYNLFHVPRIVQLCSASQESRINVEWRPRGACITTATTPHSTTPASSSSTASILTFTKCTNTCIINRHQQFEVLHSTCLLRCLLRQRPQVYSRVTNEITTQFITCVPCLAIKHHMLMPYIPQIFRNWAVQGNNQTSNKWILELL
jgi:hypothetical protein